MEYKTQEERVRGNLASVMRMLDECDNLRLQIAASWLAEAIGMKKGTEFTYDSLINMACDWLEKQESIVH